VSVAFPGRIHVLLGTSAGVEYFTRPATGNWTRVALAPTDRRPASQHLWSEVAIRLDQATGHLLAVFIRFDDVAPGVYVLTKP
jgi:hypothetical protein